MFLQKLARSPLFKGPAPGKQPSRIVLWLIGFFAFLNVYGVQAVLPMIQKAFDASSVQAGIVVGVALFGIAISSPFMGMISDKVGRKNVICCSLVAMTIPAILMPLSPNLHVMMVLRFLQGLAVPGIIVSTTAYMAEEFPAIRLARTTTAYIGGAVMGGFCGRFVTGHVAEYLSSWQGGFVALALFNIVGVILIFKLLPASQHFKPNANMRQTLSILARHLHNPRLLATCMVGFCVLFSLVAMFTYVNFLLDHPPFNLNAAGLSNVFCVYLLGVIITPFSGRFTSKLGNQRTLIAALAVSSLGVALTLLPFLWAVIAGLAISSSGIFICQAASMGMLVSCTSEGRSLASGIYNLVFYLGGGVGSWVAGLAFGAYHWPGSVATIVVVQIMAALIAWFYWKPAATPSQA